MIPCPKCGTVNQMGTRFCHGCGERVNVTFGQVAASVQATAATKRDAEILHWGRSLLALGIFLVIAVLVLRAVLVGQLPPAEPPPMPIVELVPRHAPGAPPAEAGSGPRLVLRSQRLLWRALHGRPTLSAMGLDPTTIEALQKPIADSQKTDGSFPGPEPLAATALACLALQSLPDEVGLNRSARARGWIKDQFAGLPAKPAVVRSLALLALLDAEELTQGQRSSLGTYLNDGKAGPWQAIALAMTPVAERPTETILVRKAVDREPWTWLLALADGQRPQLELRNLFKENATALTRGEDRLAWALAAWQLALAPADLAEVLKGWSKATPAAIDKDLATVCGPAAASAVHILVLSAPTRLPPTWSTPAP